MTYGKDGILKENPKYILINTAFKHDIEGSEPLKFGLHKANQAWALTLHKAGIINKKDINILLTGLLKLEKEDFELNEAYGDIYNSFSIGLYNLIGEKEGLLHIARPRREAVNISYLIALKEKVYILIDEILALLSIFLKVSKNNKETIMPDLTYLHHAQPTTFAHYILTFAFPLLRELDKLELLFNHIDSSPAGSGSVNGTSLPINREYVKKLLSFSKISLHTRDAMWQVDTPIELISILSSTMTNINRFVDELQIFNTSEFSLIKLPDSMCRASVIMPQKQNPYPLAYIRGVAGEVLGKTASYSAYGKIPSGNPDSRTFIYIDLLKILDKVIGAIHLFGAVLEDIEFNKELALERVKNSFLFATDIADWLVLNDNIPYKKAHEIVGAVIRKMQENKINASEIDILMFKELYPETKLTNEILHKLIDPKHIVNSRTSLGGANDLENIWETLEKSISKNKQKTNNKTMDFTFLTNEIAKILKGGEND